MSRWQKIKKFFRDNFFSGLLVVAPAVASIYIFVQLLQWLYGKLLFLTFDKDKLAALIEPMVPAWAIEELIQLFKIGEFLVLVLAIVILTALVGMGAKIGLIRWLFRWAERMLEKIPLLGMVYSALKQFLEAIFSGKTQFNKVVLIEFPSPGLYAIGFLSRESDDNFKRLLGQDRLFNVFVPTVPNITTGFMLVTPESKFIPIDITVEQAFKLIMSGGMVLPHEDVEAAFPEGESLIKRIKSRAEKRKTEKRAPSKPDK